MKKIVGIVKPFSPTQIFYVFEGDEEITKEEYPSTDNVIINLFALIEKYDIKQVDLSGSKNYLSKYVQDLKKMQVQKYSDSDIVINII